MAQHTDCDSWSDEMWDEAELILDTMDFDQNKAEGDIIRTYEVTDPDLSEQYISEGRFHIWNEYHDHEYCSCSSGSYDAGNGSIRFYYRRMGEKKAPYARQLVYTADDPILAGFTGKEIRFDKDK